MDYLDPKKLRQHRIQLFIGYGLVAIAIGLLVIILLFQAYGYNYKQGQVVRDGLVFFSSEPNQAKLSVDGVSRGNTSQRLQLQAGNYRVVMSRSGYRSWQRTVSVVGGEIERFDYPILFPKELKTTTTDSFVEAPAIASESLDNHKLLVSFASQLGYFDLYNLALPDSTGPTEIKLPANVLTAYKGKQSLSVVQWSKDDEHVLLEHDYGNSREYVLLDTADPSQSLNLNAALGLSPSKLTLDGDYYDQYFVYDADSQTLSLASLGSQKLKTLLKRVVSYTDYQGNVLYIQSAKTKVGSTRAVFYDDGKNYPVANVDAGKKYLLSLTKYNGNWYAAVTSRSQGVTKIYKNPLSSSLSRATATMAIENPTYQEISPDDGYMFVESGQNFATYDMTTGRKYAYKLPERLDAPQKHASWMREGQIDYVSGGKLLAFDFDGTNRHSLMAASPDYSPFFDINYDYAYTFVPDNNKSDTHTLLTQTPLLTTKDLP